MLWSRWLHDRGVTASGNNDRRRMTMTIDGPRNLEFRSKAFKSITPANKLCNASHPSGSPQPAHESFSSITRSTRLLVQVPPARPSLGTTHHFLIRIAPTQAAVPHTGRSAPPHRHRQTPLSLAGDPTRARDHRVGHGVEESGGALRPVARPLLFVFRTCSVL